MGREGAARRMNDGDYYYDLKKILKILKFAWESRDIKFEKF